MFEYDLIGTSNNQPADLPTCPPHVEEGSRSYDKRSADLPTTCRRTLTDEMRSTDLPTR